LKQSETVEKALGLRSSHTDQKYLTALAETYENVSGWDTRRQVLSIMADLVPVPVIQQYIPGMTEYRIKVARQHKSRYGRGVPVEAPKSPRMRVDESQLDHFLSFITSPHVIQDLPFGQRYLQLSNGQVLETPNAIRTMIPQRIVDQYQQFCSETEFVPFSASTMLRILSSCSASVRKSLQGLDYLTADGTKAIDDLIAMAEKLGDYGQDQHWVQQCRQSLKRGKQYLKADYKVIVNFLLLMNYFPVRTHTKYIMDAYINVIHSFIHLFSYLFIFVRSLIVFLFLFIGLFVCLLVCLYVYWFVCMFIG